MSASRGENVVVECSYDAVCFDLFGTLVGESGEPLPGAHEALVAVAGARWAIVTSCGLRAARALIAEARFPEPPLLVTAGDVIATKPSPDPYVLAAQRLGVVAGRSLAVEDSASGIASARAAGMDVVAVLRGRGLACAREATWTFHSIGDLAQALKTQATGGVRLTLPV